MDLKLVVALSQKKYGTSDTVYKINGVNTSGGGIDRDVGEWLVQLSVDAGGSSGGALSFSLAEFNYFEPSNSVEFVDETVARMLGFDTGVIYPASTLNEATKWGASKLVLQNSENPAPLPNSMIKSFEEKAIDFAKSTKILRGFAPISNYDKESDRESYIVSVRTFPAARRVDLKDFLDFNTNNIAEIVNVYGFDFKISETIDLNVNVGDYNGISEHFSNKNLKQFEIGFIVAV